MFGGCVNLPRLCAQQRRQAIGRIRINTKAKVRGVDKKSVCREHRHTRESWKSALKRREAYCYAVWVKYVYRKTVQSKT